MMTSREEEREKKYRVEDIRSIKIYPKNDDEYNSDDGNDIADIVYLPEISSVKRKEDKFYQHLVPIGNGIYDGTINEKLLREGQGIYSINNGEEYYSGSWKDDKPDGYDFNFKNHGSIIYHDILKLVAEWKEGKTEFIYINDIEQYYKNQYEVFYNSLESIILLNNENQQKRRQYLQILIGLFEKCLSNLSLLKEIVTSPILPRELKISANLLFKLDHSYTNLNK
ncbi:unnamed protein product [Rotaria sordida]|uniref:Uncharacterized protein n=1 Tax=Rotaria sordida TaxID=392033 RepID=A0A815BAH1_9BILA|nr:unnamed protein product [Rotaria sordida]CAF4160397.1 unnamed protein product [Rotaria sordida]